MKPALGRVSGREASEFKEPLCYDHAMVAMHNGLSLLLYDEDMSLCTLLRHDALDALHVATESQRAP